jgi:EmrB/QacA subfamily drug resistance transporter
MDDTETRVKQGTAAGPGIREWRILAVVLVGSFMAVLDTTIVNVALPSIAQGIKASSDALEWVVSGYALTFGLALVPAGRLGDRLGYKQMFLTGLTVFTLASVACGISRTPAELIVSRLVQGLGAGIYFPAISATIQRQFAGDARSRAFGYLGGVVGISTALGPLLGGVLIQLTGMSDGWRWVFGVNLFVGAIGIPVAVKVLPRRREREQHDLDLIGSALLTGVLLLVLVPLVDGRVAGWPPWSWIVLAASVPVGALLVAWEVRLARRGGEPVLQVQLIRRHRSFAVGQALALLYFAGFTSLFFTLSILWQQGLGRSALQTGVLVLPFAVASLSTASNSYRFSTRFGRRTVQGGLAAMFAGLALVLLVLHLAAPRPVVWDLIGPLFLAGLGNGLVIAPNQDFVLGSVPRGQAGTAGGALITAQRIGAAIGIAVIGTALFGRGNGGQSSSAKLMPSLAHTAQAATAVNLAFVLAAWLCTFGLPRTLSAGRAEENQ